MRVREEYVEGPFYNSRVFSEYFGGKKIVVADIETTGLSPKSNAAILGGLVTSDGRNRLVRQFFAENPEEEAGMLEGYCRALADHDVIVTYNGDSFDIPFLVKRMRKHGMDPRPLEALYSLDMYKVVRKHSHLKKLLPDLKQKTVEAYLGDAAARTDQISGKDSAELYDRMTKCRLPGQREVMIADILLHNRDDVVRLSDMMRILRSLDLHKILFAEGIPMMAGDRRMVLREAAVGKKEIRARGQLYGDVMDYSYYGDGVSIQISGRKREAEICVQLESVSGYLVADVQSMGIDDGAVRELGGYESGYLIVRDNSGRVMYREANRLLTCAASAVLQ